MPACCSDAWAPHANFEFNVLIRCSERITIITSNLIEKKLNKNVASSKTSSMTPDVHGQTITRFGLNCSFSGDLFEIGYIPIVLRINIQIMIEDQLDVRMLLISDPK
jgi:hypothetical protein